MKDDIIEYSFEFSGEFNNQIDWKKFYQAFNNSHAEKFIMEESKIASFYNATKKYVQGDTAQYHEHCQDLKSLRENDGLELSIVETGKNPEKLIFVLSDNKDNISFIEDYPYAMILNEIILATGNKINKIEVKNERIVEDSYEVGSDILKLHNTSNRKMKM